ncbi:MAG: hypothetical protein ACREJQ_00755 [bacterium]
MARKARGMIHKDWKILALSTLINFLFLQCGGSMTNQPPRGILTAEVVGVKSGKVNVPPALDLKYTLRFYDMDGGTVNTVLFYCDGTQFTMSDSGVKVIGRGRTETKSFVTTVHPYFIDGKCRPHLELHDDDGSPVVTVYLSQYTVSGDDMETLIQVLLNKGKK